MTESVINIVNSLQVIELKPFQVDKQNFENDCYKWEKDAASIETRLRTYFPSNPIMRSWNMLSELIEGFYKPPEPPSLSNDYRITGKRSREPEASRQH